MAAHTSVCRAFARCAGSADVDRGAGGPPADGELCSVGSGCGLDAAFTSASRFGPTITAAMAATPRNIEAKNQRRLRRASEETGSATGRPEQRRCERDRHPTPSIARDTWKHAESGELGE